MEIIASIFAVGPLAARCLSSFQKKRGDVYIKLTETALVCPILTRAVRAFEISYHTMTRVDFSQRSDGVRIFRSNSWRRSGWLGPDAELFSSGFASFDEFEKFHRELMVRLGEKNRGKPYLIKLLVKFRIGEVEDVVEKM